MDLSARLLQLEDLVRDAKSMPLSSSALLNRDEVLELIDEMKDALPDEIKQARWIVKDREELLAKARRDAETMVEQARQEQLRLASHEAVVQRGQRGVGADRPGGGRRRAPAAARGGGLRRRQARAARGTAAADPRGDDRLEPGPVEDDRSGRRRVARSCEARSPPTNADIGPDVPDARDWRTRRRDARDRRSRPPREPRSGRGPSTWSEPCPVFARSSPRCPRTRRSRAT